jgi:hypothetical protein
MRDVPQIVQELRNAELCEDDALSIQNNGEYINRDHSENTSLAVDDYLDDIWFNMYRFL